MPDDGIATGFEADAGLQRIEIAVEFVAEGDRDTHCQDAGGLVAFGTSSWHGGPPWAVNSEQTGVKWEHSADYFIQEIFFVNRKDATRPTSRASVRQQQRDPRVVYNRCYLRR
jgi:hypothetical protein